LGKGYLFAVYLPHNSLRLFETYGPLIDHLNRNVSDIRFRLETSPNCDEFHKKSLGRQFDFALANPSQTLDSLHHGYHVIAKMVDDHQYGSVILVRRDSGIRKVADLKGKTVAYPNRGCLTGAILPQYYLINHDLDVNRDIENLYVGSHESVILNVYLGLAAAGGVRRWSWELFQRDRPDKARELVAQWEIEPLINSAVVVRDDVPPQIVALVVQLLETLHTGEAGRDILARMVISRFEQADDAHYRAVEDLLSGVEQTLRPTKAQHP